MKILSSRGESAQLILTDNGAQMVVRALVCYWLMSSIQKAAFTCSLRLSWILLLWKRWHCLIQDFPPGILQGRHNRKGTSKKQLSLRPQRSLSSHREDLSPKKKNGGRAQNTNHGFLKGFQFSASHHLHIIIPDHHPHLSTVHCPLLRVIDKTKHNEVSKLVRSGGRVVGVYPMTPIQLCAPVRISISFLLSWCLYPCLSSFYHVPWLGSSFEP